MSRDNPLHIVQIVCTQRHAGVENYVARLSSALVRRGHRVSVLTRLPSAIFLSDDVESFDIENWREGARVLRSLKDVDVVNSHLTEADTAAVWGLRGRSTPLVSTHHFASPRWSSQDGQGSAMLRFRWRRRDSSPGPVLRALRTRVDERIDLEVAVSDFVARGIGRSDETVLTGVEVQGPLPSVDEREKKVVVLQRLEPVKSTKIALEAWDMSSARSKGWFLEIHGEGSERDSLIEEVRRRGLQDSVTVLGRCETAGDLLRSASLLLAPAVGDPFPLTVLEAMSFGVPVVAAASGGHLESLGRVPGSALFPPGDSRRCAELMQTLLEDPGSRQALAIAQRAEQIDNFSLESMAERFEKVYRNLIDSKR